MRAARRQPDFCRRLPNHARIALINSAVLQTATTICCSMTAAVSTFHCQRRWRGATNLRPCRLQKILSTFPTLRASRQNK